MRRIFRWFVSARVTVTLLALLALLLLLNVVIPQKALVGERQYEAIAASDGISRFLLVTLGLGQMPTSPVFLAVLGLFFLNLSAVLLSRLGPTWRRITLRPRSEKGLKAWARMEENLSAPLPDRWRPGQVAETLRGFGFQVRRQGEETFWGVKHRTAPLGFLLFHLSFFLICAGGVMLYYTRFVGTATLAEGQELSGGLSDVLREPPLGDTPDLVLMVDRVDMAMEDGEPVHLEAQLQIQTTGGASIKTSRVNHPARWGPVSILVQRAGLAPVLWFQDERGFTIDRVVAAATTRGVEPTIVPVNDEDWNLVISPLAPGSEFPPRDKLPSTAMSFQLLGEEQSLLSTSLRPGEAASFPGGRLVLEEIRYWVGIRVIAERGGGLLIVGFTAGILGLVWRLLWYRREVVVTWDEQSFYLVGRSEYFSERFLKELKSVFSMLERGGLEASQKMDSPGR